MKVLLLVIFVELNVHYAGATWPALNGSGMQVLGLFPDAVNASDTSELSIHSRAMFKAAVVLSHRYHINIDGQFLEWQTAQTGGNTIDALASSCQSLSTANIVGIVGPAYSRETPVIADFGEKVGIPVVSYSATAPDLSNRNEYPAFYRTVPSDSSAARATVKLFIRFNWTSCIIVHQNDAFGSGGAKMISEAFRTNGLSVQNTLAFDIATLSFRDDFKSILTNSSTRIVILWALSSYTQSILQQAIASDVLGPSFTWILSSSISFGSFDRMFHPKLVGMLTIEPVTANVVGGSMNRTLLNAAYDIWKQYEPETFPDSTAVNYYAQFAFDATWLLIQSLQQLCSTVTNSSLSCLPYTNSSSCFDRRFLRSGSLFDTINEMTFLGVSGMVQFNSNATDRTDGSYYSAQNSQIDADGVKFVPVLGYSERNSWQRYDGTSAIIWPGGTFVVPAGNAKLAGVKLRIGIISSPPFTFVSTVTDEFGQKRQIYTGYAPDLIELLQARIGFIPDVQLATLGGGYEPVVRALAKGAYDILVGDFTVTAARREYVDFSSAIYDNALVIVMRRNTDIVIDLLSFLRPFSVKLWLLTLGAVMCAALLFCLVEREYNEVLKDSSTSTLIAMSTWYCFGNLVGYGAGFNAATAAGRLLTVGLYILSLVLVATYTANLASDFTISRSKVLVSGLDDVKKGVIPFSRIGIRVGAASETYFLREVSEGRRNYFQLKDKQETYDRLLNGTIDLTLMDIGIAEYVTNNIYCNLVVVGKSFNKGAMSIVMPKNWLYKQDLDIHVLGLREAGELDRLKSKWVDAKACPVVSETVRAIDIEPMSGLYLVFAVICILALLLSVGKKRQCTKERLYSLPRSLWDRSVTPS